MTETVGTACSCWTEVCWSRRCSIPYAARVIAATTAMIPHRRRCRGRGKRVKLASSPDTRPEASSDLQVSPNLRISPLSIPLGSLSPECRKTLFEILRTSPNALGRMNHVRKTQRKRGCRLGKCSDRHVRDTIPGVRSYLMFFILFNGAREARKLLHFAGVPAILKERNFWDSRIHKGLIRGWDAALALPSVRPEGRMRDFSGVLTTAGGLSISPGSSRPSSKPYTILALRT